MKTEKLYKFVYVQKPFEAYPRSAIVKTHNFYDWIESADQYGMTILRYKQISDEDFSKIQRGLYDFLDDLKDIKEVNLNKNRKNA